MFIQTESTPNPHSLKFIPGIVVSTKGTHRFRKEEEAHYSPLAKQLINIVGVKEVFFGEDFITITKIEAHQWDILKTEILLTLTDCFSSNIPIIIEITENSRNTDQNINIEEDKITKEIREIIDTRIRPAVAQDGGDIVFHSFKDGVVKVKMHGACSGCPSSTVTLKNGIESMLQYYVPEVVSVEAIEDEPTDNF